MNNGKNFYIAFVDHGEEVFRLARNLDHLSARRFVARLNLYEGFNTYKMRYCVRRIEE